MVTSPLDSAEIAPELLKLLKKANEVVDKMTPEEKEQMMKAQAESWCRQDMD